MDFKEFKTGDNDISRRIDKVVRIFASGLSLPEIYKAMRKGLIKVNNSKIKSDYRINKGDLIYIASFLVEKNEKQENIKQQSSFFENNKKNKFKMPQIVFENQYILIVNKPYNTNVHGGENSLDKIIENYYETNNKNNSLSFKPGPLHRLDRNTTGLLAFSMNLQGAQWFSENIKNHNIKKTYFGLVQGKFTNNEIWRDLISKDDNKNNGFYKVSARKYNENLNFAQEENEKIAETEAIPLEQGIFNGTPVTLVQFNIKTGRKHQIRAQSALHGHSLLGDTAYGGIKLPKEFQNFYLTAGILNFPKNNPINLPEKIAIPLSESFQMILKHCGIRKTIV